MLKGIPAILSPELLKRLCEMGHSDRVLIADGNFPSHTVGANAHVIRMDGHGNSGWDFTALSLGHLHGKPCENHGKGTGRSGGYPYLG